MALKKSFKNRWLKALRSGKFKQGRQSLVDRNSETNAWEYCCLGVARKIFKLRKSPDGKEFLSLPSCAKIGLTDAQQEKLASLNDDRKLVSKGPDGGYKYEYLNDFNKIADYIEKNL